MMNRRCAQIELLYQGGLISEPEWNSFAMMAPFNQISLHYSDPAELGSWLSDYWTVQKTFYAQDYSRSELHPVWLMRRTEVKA